MKYLDSYKIFESKGKIYYHGRESGRRPFHGNYIFLTDNIGYGISFSDMKELYCYTLLFPETEICSLSNKEHYNILKRNVSKEVFNSLLEASDIEIDWANFGNLHNDNYEDGEDLLKSLGFKAVKLRERPGIYSVYVFDQNNVNLKNIIDLTTPKMVKFSKDWFANPGFYIPEYIPIGNFKKFERSYWGNCGAGIIPFCSETKRFLIGLRSDAVYEPNTYSGFGGKLDTDEIDENIIQETAIRELEEETGYNNEINLIKGYVFKDDNFEYHNYIGIVHYEFKPILNWENDKAMWLTYDKLINLKNKHHGLKDFLKYSRNIFENLL